MALTRSLIETDPEIARLVQEETARQETGLELIASENFVSPAVLEAASSTLTNKYSEGYPGKRYYGGNEVVDKVEQLAIDRVRKLFNAEYANVQPHSGAQANMAVYSAFVNPGDAVLAMSLSFGGHLTHGSPVNFSGKLYKIIAYGLRQSDETIDYDELARLAREHKPKLIWAGASAYPRTIHFDKFAQVARDVGAKLAVDMAHVAGLVAAGLHPSPVSLADATTSTTHKTLRGPRGGLILAREEYAKTLNSQIFPGTQGGPLEHIIAAKAVAFQEALQPDFKTYQKQIIDNSQALAQGLTAAGLRLVSGGTDNHLVLVDLRSKKITGKAAEEALGRANITVNRNMIPWDPEKPMTTSGVRIGTPALTTRGFGTAEMKTVARLIGRVLDAPADEQVLSQVRGDVRALCQAFPLYPNLPKRQAL